MSRRVTVLLSVAVAAVVAWSAHQQLSTYPLEYLETPNRTTVRVMERSVEIAVAAEGLPAWIRWLAGTGSPEGARALAREAYDDLLEADVEIAWDASLAVVASARDGLARPVAVDPVLRRSVLVYGLGLAILLGTGVLLVGVWLLRGRPWPILGTGHPCAPWSAEEGYAVAVRSLAVAIVVFALIYWIAPFLYSGATLWASLGMVWLIRSRLLRPRGLGLRDGFGLHLQAAPGRLALVAVAALAVEVAGLCVVWHFAGGAHWTDFVGIEALMLGSADEVFLELGSLLLWAPLFEEIGFRGLVFGTLRARLPCIALHALVNLHHAVWALLLYR